MSKAAPSATRICVKFTDLSDLTINAILARNAWEVRDTPHAKAVSVGDAAAARPGAQNGLNRGEQVDSGRGHAVARVEDRLPGRLQHRLDLVRRQERLDLHQDRRGAGAMRR